jgi:hypothetical protein
MFELLKKDAAPRYITIEQFVKITQLSFIDYHALKEEGKVPIIRKDGGSFVDLVAMAEMVAQQNEIE